MCIKWIKLTLHLLQAQGVELKKCPKKRFAFKNQNNVPKRTARAEGKLETASAASAVKARGCIR